MAASKTYKLGLASGARLDVISQSFPNAVQAARALGGDAWISAIQVTSGPFEVDLSTSKVYADFAIAGPLAVTPGTNLLPYLYTMLTLTANGANAPTFPGFTKWGGSLDWNNTTGKINYVMLFSDGVTPFYSIVPAL